ncbi:MAG: HRDC domain-containing protein, partial [Gemmatimonadota bacterium]|nr:HRDC domain-containing protein [Gemmatimonadota bacterium]
KKDKKGRRTAAIAADLPEEALPVFERLRSWRRDTALEHGVPAYVIFHDATLMEIARVRPATLRELSTIAGVGERKLDAYGGEILALV